MDIVRQMSKFVQKEAWTQVSKVFAKGTRTFARHPDNLQEDLLPNWSNSGEM